MAIRKSSTVKTLRNAKAVRETPAQRRLLKSTAPIGSPPTFRQVIVAEPSRPLGFIDEIPTVEDWADDLVERSQRARDARNERARLDREVAARESLALTIAAVDRVTARKLKADMQASLARKAQAKTRTLQAAGESLRDRRVDFFLDHRQEYLPVKTPRAKTPVKYATSFPTSYVWVRTYPTDMYMADSDHLAVASGAFERWSETPERFTFTPESTDPRTLKVTPAFWKENLSGISFNDVDVGYLDYVAGTSGTLCARNVRLYMSNEGSYRFTDRVLAGKKAEREVGWMYATLGTLLAYQARRDSFSDLSQSGYDDPEDPGDRGLTSGRTWTSESFQWTPPVEHAYTIREAIKGKALLARYESRKAGEASSLPGLGKVKFKSALVVQHASGEWELPGQWIPSPTPVTIVPIAKPLPVGETLFVDRHAWSATLHTADELRELYSDIRRLGSEVMPPDNSSSPSEWVMSRVDELMGLIPSSENRLIKGDHALVGMITACLQLARAIRKEIDLFDQPLDNSPASITEEDLVHLCSMHNDLAVI